jgi:hypothetical protein
MAVDGATPRTLTVRQARTTVVVGLSRRQQSKAEQAAAVQPATPTDPIAQLKELAALKDQGILTEEELAAQKARIREP